MHSGSRNFRATSFWKPAMPRAFGQNPSPIVGAKRDAVRAPDHEFEEAHRRLRREPGRFDHPPQESKPSRLPLIAAIVAVLIGAMALIGLRDFILRIAPPAAAIYSGLGFDVDSRYGGTTRQPEASFDGGKGPPSTRLASPPPDRAGAALLRFAERADGRRE
jgi:hypothetical protein